MEVYGESCMDVRNSWKLCMEFETTKSSTLPEQYGGELVLYGDTKTGELTFEITLVLLLPMTYCLYQPDSDGIFLFKKTC